MNPDKHVMVRVMVKNDDPKYRPFAFRVLGRGYWEQETAHIAGESEKRMAYFAPEEDETLEPWLRPPARYRTA